MNIDNLQIVFLIVVLIYISVYDIRKHIIKNRIVLGLALVRIGFVLTNIQSENAMDFLLLILGFVFIGILGFGLKSVINIGSGDIKLIMTCELYLGFSKTILMSALSLGFLDLCAIGLLITKKATVNSTLPVAPFITVTVFMILLF